METDALREAKREVTYWRRQRDAARAVGQQRLAAACARLAEDCAEVAAELEKIQSEWR